MYVYVSVCNWLNYNSYMYLCMLLCVVIFICMCVLFGEIKNFFVGGNVIG